jgi:hypothetical protein
MFSHQSQNCCKLPHSLVYLQILPLNTLFSLYANSPPYQTLPLRLQGGERFCRLVLTSMVSASAMGFVVWLVVSAGEASDAFFCPLSRKSTQKACNRLLYYIMNDHINGSNEMYLFVNCMFIAEYQYSANHLIITITAMGYIPKPTCSTWRGIFCPSKGGAISCSTGYRKYTVFRCTDLPCFQQIRADLPCFQ